MQRLIAFTGPIGCGKTTAARVLEDLGWEIVSFAKPLKKAAMDIFMLKPEQVYTLEGKQTIDPRWGMSPREILRKLGTDAIRAVFPNVWAKHTEIYLNSLPQSREVVIDDLRFPDEESMVRGFGGTIIHIQRGNVMLSGSDHVSEKGLRPGPYDYVMDNDGTLEEFQSRIKHMLI